MKAAFLLPFIAAADVPLTMTWDEFKAHFGMAFNGEEDASRASVFAENMAFIEESNAAGNSFTLGVNQFSHLTNAEFKAQFTGVKGGSAIGPDDAHLGELEVGEIAADVDWSTDKSVVNPVKDQGQCGSCWAFSAVGTVESAYALAAGKLGSYAEQQLVDCDTTGPTGGSQGCNGGFNQYGISYIGSTGIAAESSYPYTATDGSCKASSVSKALAQGSVAGYQSVGKNNAALQSAITSGPVSVTVDADNSWQSYRSGVLSKACGVFGRIDHAVIAVGYDSSADTFKIRNSWGASWGEAGYVRIDNSVSNPYCLYQTSPFVAQISADVTV
jgi:C1A family cysteine protease